MPFSFLFFVMKKLKQAEPSVALRQQCDATLQHIFVLKSAEAPARFEQCFIHLIEVVIDLTEGLCLVL